MNLSKGPPMLELEKSLPTTKVPIFSEEIRRSPRDPLPAPATFPRPTYSTQHV